jgi:hypothetical protein
LKIITEICLKTGKNNVKSLGEHEGRGEVHRVATMDNEL